MSCDPFHVGDCIKEGISSGMESMAQSFKEGAEWAMKNLTTAWLNAPAPDVNSSTSVTGWIQDHLNYFVGATMLLSVLVASYRLATTGKFEHRRDLAESLTRVVVVTAIAGTVTTLGVAVGELFSKWILDQSKIDFSQTVVLGAAQQPDIIILLGIVVIIAQVIQLGLILIRNGMIVILAGILPLAAAAGNTQMGRQWWQKSFAWLLAFVLYKPVAALIYAAAFRMASKEQDLATQLSGIFMMLLAIFALPALMRFMVPATAAMSGGNAGAMAGAVAGAALATGAVLATGGGAAAAGGASGGFGGASGAATTGPAATGGAMPTGSPPAGTSTTGGDAGAGTTGATGSPRGTSEGAPGLGSTGDGGATGQDGSTAASGGAMPTGSPPAGASTTGGDAGAGTTGATGSPGGTSEGAPGLGSTGAGGATGQDGSTAASGVQGDGGVPAPTPGPPAPSGTGGGSRGSTALDAASAGMNAARAASDTASGATGDQS